MRRVAGQQLDNACLEDAQPPPVGRREVYALPWQLLPVHTLDSIHHLHVHVLSPGPSTIRTPGRCQLWLGKGPPGSCHSKFHGMPTAVPDSLYLHRLSRYTAVCTTVKRSGRNRLVLQESYIAVHSVKLRNRRKHSVRLRTFSRPSNIWSAGSPVRSSNAITPSDHTSAASCSTTSWIP